LTMTILIFVSFRVVALLAASCSTVFMNDDDREFSD
jgi:hypothetical protein